MNERIDIKLIRSLSQKKYRDETGLFVAEGEKMVQEALNSPFNVVNVIRK
jgi:TrmH family RNA methyltransferase